MPQIPQQILACDLKLLLAEENNIVLLDVRNEYEHIAKNIPDSILIPLDELPQRLPELQVYKARTIIVYCKAGVRSMAACEFLAEHGFTVSNLVGGILAWG